MPEIKKLDCVPVRGIVQPVTPNVDLSTTNNLLTGITEKLIQLININILIIEQLSKTDTIQYTKYYNTSFTAVTVSTPTRPGNVIATPTTAGYDPINIYNMMGRNSPHISIINDGTDSLFVLVSADGKEWSADENPILVGEARMFHNIYEMRIRSPTAGNISNPISLTGGVYRVTEHDYSLAYTSTVTINKGAFTTVNASAPLAGTLLPSTAVPNGFALVIRASIDNATGSRVFIANSIANTLVAANRNSLEPGATTKLNVNNANLVAVAGSIAGLTVDILVEQ